MSNTISSVIYPLDNIRSLISGNEGFVNFTIYKRLNQIYLQWEPFIGYVQNDNTVLLNIKERIYDTPRHNISIPINVSHKGTDKIAYMLLDHTGLKIMLNFKCSKYDQLIFYGNNINWLI